jgi:ribonuclease T2
MKLQASLMALALGLAACGQPPAGVADTASAPPAVYAQDERSSDPQDGDAPRAPAEAGVFDYYILALSWSPSYCAGAASAERDPLQCDGTRPFAFVVHGLWPQNERGWPEACATEQPADVGDELKDSMLDLMPSPNLIEHEWDKHGTCAGVSQDDYFRTVRAFRERVRIPQEFARLPEARTITAAEIEAAFIAANSGLDDSGIAVSCNRGRLREVRVCFSREGAFRSCGTDVRDTCGDEAVTMLPTRGPRRG